MPPVGFEPTISTGELPQILDRASSGTDSYTHMRERGNVILSSDEHNCSEELYILRVSCWLDEQSFSTM